MEIGNQIRSLRQQRGITQETLAEKLGVSPQAVSKWERDAAMPDIQLLPAISAYFGVTIDELFALSDDTRMERIQNMLWNERVLDPATVEREREFLLEKGRREPENATAYALLAEVENQLAAEHRAKAEEYAKEALSRDPMDPDAHSELVSAMGGRCPDWCAANHHKLIDWYKEFLEEHPDNRRGYLWLLDQLIDDQRFEEAEEYCGRLAQADHTFRTPLYRGLIAWYAGRREEAMAVWEQMQRDFPDEWCVWLSMGDVMVKMGRYEQGKAYYRKALDIQQPPRYTDGTTSIAHVCEILGDWDGAIAAHEEELNIIATDWNCTSGETVDQHHREIARLRAKKEQS
ncbi:MAG: helix-turn-helix domain-containing protein [Oscillospiraceae bacterium]|nr:helix-turn-helix domain-containing protein [Oscillospiraceae bacterium]